MPKAQLPPTGSSAPSEDVAIATTDEVNDTKEKLNSKATTSQHALPCTSSGMQMKGTPNFLNLSLQSWSVSGCQIMSTLRKDELPNNLVSALEHVTLRSLCLGRADSHDACGPWTW